MTPAIRLLDIVVEQVTGNDHVLNHLSIPAACFTHPEISMVGLTEVCTFYICFIMFQLPTLVIAPHNQVASI